MIISFNPLLASCHPSRSAHLDLDIPVITVLGSQSTGKSSLIEAISGITLPRASGTCTRYASSNSRLHPSHAPYRIPAGVRQNVSFRTPPSHGVALSRSVWSQMRMESRCCVVSLRMVTDENGVDLPQPYRVEFGDPIFDKPLVTERIRRAQYAILNPNTPTRRFLEASLDSLEGRELSFSSNSVCLEISGNGIDDLFFVDLPGVHYEGQYSQPTKS